MYTYHEEVGKTSQMYTVVVRNLLLYKHNRVTVLSLDYLMVWYTNMTNPCSFVIYRWVIKRDARVS